VSQANSQVPPSFWRVFEESPTQRAIQQVVEAMREQQAQVISQAAQAMIPDLRDLVARSQPDLTSVAQTLAARRNSTA
jgi:hypothetical protein